MNKITISNNLIKDLKQYGELMCVGMATQVRDDLKSTTIDALGMFYVDYKPKYYKRHYYNFMDKSYQKFYKNPHGSIVRGGIYLTYEYMDNIYQDDTEEVFDMVYHGFHGVSSGFDEPKRFSTTPIMSPSPLDIIEKKRDDIVNNIEQYQKYGFNRAKNNQYTTLSIC